MDVNARPAMRRESVPSTSARPLVRGKMFIRTLIAVVVPAPFGPTSAYLAPSGTSRLTLSRAVTLRNFFPRSWVRIALFIACLFPLGLIPLLVRPRPPAASSARRLRQPYLHLP